MVERTRGCELNLESGTGYWMHVLSEPLPNAVVQVPCTYGLAEMIMNGSMIQSGD